MGDQGLLSLEVLMLFLPKSCAALPALAGDKSRSPLHCVRVRELKGGAFRLEASNGKVLGILRGTSLPGPHDRAAGQKLPTPSALAMEALVPARQFARAARSVSRDQQMAVLLGSREVILAAGE